MPINRTGRQIILNPDSLGESYSPPYIIGRENQTEELKLCIAPVYRRIKPVNVWIYGPSGSGKTIAAKYLLGKLQKEYNVNGVYINCWENSTLHSIMDKIVRELRMLGAEKISTVFKLEQFTKFIEGKPFLLILDEIDQPMPKDRNLILYNLCDIGRLGLLCISAEKKSIFELDERVRSRLNPKLMEFPSYSIGELHHILNQRAESALSPETWDSIIIDKICALANGDARIAIQTLKNAAIVAENERSPAINSSHLEKGWTNAKGLKMGYILNSLTIHHRMIYFIIKKKGAIMSGDLWNFYLSQCKKRKMQPMASRTFSLYIQQLISKNLIKWERAGIRGNVRVFKIADRTRPENNMNLMGDNLGNT